MTLVVGNMLEIKDQFIAIGDACRKLSRDLLLLADVSATHIQQAANHDQPKVNPNFVDELLPSKTVSAMLSVSMSSLEKWRKKGKPPHWIQLNGTRSVRYKRTEILKFLAGREVRHD
jgi:predicted DNA-binding transcriptional regulator AlpA